MFYFFYRIDDIQDNSILRRGIPVAHSVYGIASSLNAANYILFIALERVINLQHPAVSNHILTKKDKVYFNCIIFNFNCIYKKDYR